MIRCAVRISAVGILVYCMAATAVAQKKEEPQPRYVNPGDATHAPSDAVVLFNGKDLTGWVTKDGKPARCAVEAGVIACTSGAGNIYTTGVFGSAQIHLEFATPSMLEQRGQMRGNSGVYLQGKYEIQILDSYQNPTYANGSLGAVYGQAAPLVNVARPPGEWQVYDIIFRAPKCDGSGNVIDKAIVTVLLNGVLVQDHVAIEKSAGCEPAPLMLQDHSGFKNAPVTSMRFRNIWYRPLEEGSAQR